MRVVSLNCSNTEIVCELGCADMLVGVDHHSDYPEDVVQKLPRVGPDLGIDIDKVKALEPDLVIGSLTVPGHEKIIDALERTGLNYIAPEPVSLEDVYRDILQIAGLLGVEARGRQVVDELRARIGPLATAGSQSRPRILVQWWPKPVIAPGRLSWVNDLLAAAGGANPLQDREVKSTPLEDAEVAALNPDAIVISWCGVQPDKYRPHVIYRNSAWGGLPALVNRRVYCVPEACLGRPSPRLLDGYRALRDIVDAIR